MSEFLGWYCEGMRYEKRVRVKQPLRADNQLVLVANTLINCWQMIICSLLSQNNTRQKSCVRGGLYSYWLLLPCHLFFFVLELLYHIIVKIIFASELQRAWELALNKISISAINQFELFSDACVYVSCFRQRTWPNILWWQESNNSCRIRSSKVMENNHLMTSDR